MRILMVGLDAAGKTTILYKLKLGEGEHHAGVLSFRFTTTTRASQYHLLTFSTPNFRYALALLVASFLGHSSCNHDSDDWVQRGDCRIQEHLLHSLGCRWSG